MDDEDDEPQEGELVSRAPTEDDLVSMCRLLNAIDARYLIVGGFAIMYAGYGRTTGDVDLLLDTSSENEAKVYRCLESLPDKAVLQLQPGEVEKYTVVRVADEIVIDLMKSASGIDYEEASKEVVIRAVQGVPIPFASPRLLWRMKRSTHREKDAADLIFLRQQYPEVTGD
ncbi:hypothetical protein OKA05_26705 [Luteolibacter arcticus]|uniref:Nucleotidyltransferase n=1 Tax=Luteolibacter arcticus TaxID=1581411 RepID=A0ABT3GRQ1_9BACT|nr:hypothetical protein [Luteolibacter arcticus]MCW1926177.1 hypothetical protein [Luteolibacter arcticus]